MSRILANEMILRFRFRYMHYMSSRTLFHMHLLLNNKNQKKMRPLQNTNIFPLRALFLASPVNKTSCTWPQPLFWGYVCNMFPLVLPFVVLYCMFTVCTTQLKVQEELFVTTWHCWYCNSEIVCNKFSSYMHTCQTCSQYRSLWLNSC